MNRSIVIGALLVLTAMNSWAGFSPEDERKWSLTFDLDRNKSLLGQPLGTKLEVEGKRAEGLNEYYNRNTLVVSKVNGAVLTLPVEIQIENLLPLSAKSIIKLIGVEEGRPFGKNQIDRIFVAEKVLAPGSLKLVAVEKRTDGIERWEPDSDSLEKWGILSLSSSTISWSKGPSTHFEKVSANDCVRILRIPESATSRILGHACPYVRLDNCQGSFEVGLHRSIKDAEKSANEEVGHYRRLRLPLTNQ